MGSNNWQSRDNMREKGYRPISEAAAHANVSVTTLYRWVRAKKVIGFTRASQHYVQWESLLAFVGELDDLQNGGTDG
jgi:hypothetical protein